MQLTFTSSTLQYSKEIHDLSFLQQEAMRDTKEIYKKWCPLEFPEGFYINRKQIKVYLQKTFKCLEKTVKQYLKMAVTSNGLHLCVSHTLSVK